MKYYIITDTHYNHVEKMMVYCGRPDNYEELLEKSMSALTKDDVLIHLGDICIGKDKEMHEKHIAPLTCKKWLIKGNHDKKSDIWYLENGWDFVADSMAFRFNGKNILFSHIPILAQEEYDYNIHGHFHNNLDRLLKRDFRVEGEEDRNKDTLSILTDKHKLLSIEKTKYKMVELGEFLKRIK